MNQRPRARDVEIGRAAGLDAHAFEHRYRIPGDLHTACVERHDAQRAVRRGIHEVAGRQVTRVGASDVESHNSTACAVYRRELAAHLRRRVATSNHEHDDRRSRNARGPQVTRFLGGFVQDCQACRRTACFRHLMERDYPVVMGILVLTSLLFLIGNILSDICVALVDPRVKFQ